MRFLYHEVVEAGSHHVQYCHDVLLVIGIIAAMIFKKHRHYRNYKMCKKGAIAGFIVLAVILALFLLALAAVFI